MKRDLNAMESDEGLNAPPYITRSTAPRKGHLIDCPEWWAGYNAIVKHEQSSTYNKELCHVSD